MSTPKPLCWVPYYTAEITYKETKPCCKFNYSADHPYKDIRNFHSQDSEQWRRDSFLREDLLDQCSACRVPQHVHSYERQNRRAFIQDHWPEPQRAELRKLIIGMDNVCASTCLQCGPHFSTRLDYWARRNTWPMILGTDYTLPGLQQLDLSSLDGLIGRLEVLHIYGGEPLLSPNLDTLLDLVEAQSPRLRRITLSTGLCKIKASHVARLRSLSLERGIDVLANISLDADLELNSWIRGIDVEEFMAGWQLLIQARDGVKISGFQTTIGCYNVFAIKDYIKQVQSLWREFAIPNQPFVMSTVIINPNSLNPCQLRDDYKQPAAAALRTLNKQTIPLWSRELVRTALHHLEQPATLAWDIVENRLNSYPQWRGDTRTFDQWFQSRIN